MDMKEFVLVILISTVWPGTGVGVTATTQTFKSEQTCLFAKSVIDRKTRTNLFTGTKMVLECIEK
jgi:hypothetical protein